MILRHLTMIMMTAMVDPEVKDDHDNVCLEANLLHTFFFCSIGNSLFDCRRSLCESTFPTTETAGIMKPLFFPLRKKRISFFIRGPKKQIKPGVLGIKIPMFETHKRRRYLLSTHCSRVHLRVSGMVENSPPDYRPIG